MTGMSSALPAITRGPTVDDGCAVITRAALLGAGVDAASTAVGHAGR